MNIKTLIAHLKTFDQDALVVIQGYENNRSNEVAEVDVIAPCNTVERKWHPLYGDRELAVNGAPSVLLAWSKDFRGNPLEPDEN